MEGEKGVRLLRISELKGTLENIEPMILIFSLENPQPRAGKEAARDHAVDGDRPPSTHCLPKNLRNRARRKVSHRQMEAAR